MRAFFAIRLPGEVAGSLLEASEPLAALKEFSDARWIPQGNIHLTLRFLGELDADTIGQARKAAAAALSSCAPCEIVLDHIQLFPSQRRARVVAVTIQPSPELTRIAEALELVAHDIGLQAETRRFRPHVTVARLKAAQRMRPAISPEPTGQSFVAREVVLFESILRREGAVYRPVEKYRLVRDRSTSSQ